MKKMMAFLLALAAVCEAGAAEKVVAAHFMHQMSVGVETNPRDSILGIEPGRSNGIKALHTPDYLQYYAMPDAAADYDVKMMRSGGIDAIGMLLCNGHLKSQFRPVIRAYYRAAAENGLKIFPDSWSNVNAPEGLSEIYTELHRDFPASWLKRDGRLVVALMLPSQPPPYRETVEKLFAGIGGRKNVFLVLYDPVRLREKNKDWFDNADGFTAWLTMSYGESMRDLEKFYEVAKASGKEVWAPVMPSFMQSRYPHQGGKFIPNLREKLGVSYFRHAWQQAIANNSAAVMLATWNDITEDSSIMPESNHGDSIYELNRIFSTLYKTGKLPEATEEKLFLFHHPQLVEGLKLPAGVTPTEGFPLSHGKNFGSKVYHRTPPTDYLHVASFLREPATVSLYLGTQLLARYEAKPGLQFHLFYQPRNQNDPAGRYPCNEAEVYPQSEGNQTVTLLKQPLRDAEIYLEVKRNGRRLGFFRSHKPVNGFAGRGDMTMTGNLFRLKK